MQFTLLALPIIPPIAALHCHATKQSNYKSSLLSMLARLDFEPLMKVKSSWDMF